MAEFKTVMNEYNRMCNKCIKCENCPIASRNNGRGVACHLFVHQFPEEAERAIMQWASENPIITNAMKFKEVFGYDFQDAFGALGCSEWLDDEYEKGKQYD